MAHVTRERVTHYCILETKLSLPLKAKKLVHNLTTCAVQILWKDFKRS